MNERISELRKALDLTMEKFGQQLGSVSKSTISNIENGNRELTEHMLKSICREFNVNEEWLRDGTGEMFIIPEDETAAIVSEILENPDDEFFKKVVKIVKAYEQLSPSSKNVLNNFIDNLMDDNQKGID